ncbi:MAG: long-chain fatty acid--CoA ligase, partial [Acidimicrobiia bacterium]|nr:long-chain fatty acid--CoA ligase [Acidimicrobiia bacterium]
MPDWGELQEDQLRFLARTLPDELAYRNLDAGTSLTFAEWDAASNRLARGLLAIGVERGDRVSIYLPSDEVLRWIVSYAAVHKAGAVVVPTNTRQTVPELTTILGHAEIVAMLTCESLLPTALEVQTHLPALRTIITAGGAASPNLRERDDVREWDDVLHDDASDFQVPVALTDLADIMYTSGTTGLPKGIAVRHDNVAMIPNNEPCWTG